ncbi:MAG: hypothetical protein QNL61_05400 [Crocinitomicaceae bacterium]
MFKYSLAFIGMFAGFLTFAQDSFGYQWIELQTYPVKENEVWHIDVLEYYFTSDNGTINKYSLDGKLMFSQSIKSLGQIKDFVSINTSKLIHFSEEQQTLCYFDNTLTMLDDCVDLADKGLVNVTLISASSQPNKIWVFDRFNSRLLLLSLNHLNQQQEILNIIGTLDIKEVSQIKERGNRLFVVDPIKGVYIFDMYGSLMEFVPETGIIQLDAHEKGMFTLHKDKLKVRFFDSDKSNRVLLPIPDITEFIYRNQHFFFKTNTGVHKFELQISK